MINILTKLACYLECESYDSEFLSLQKILKIASEKDAKYLTGINLGALRKEFPREEKEDEASIDKSERKNRIREYYSMLNEMAKKGPHYTEEAISFIKDNIDEDLVPENRKEFIKWLGTELNKIDKRRYPDVNDIAMIKDWLDGQGWPEESEINLLDISLDYAIAESKEWHRAPAGPAVQGREITKRIVYSAKTGEKIVYEPTAAEDPVARKKLGQKLGLCLKNGLYSDNSSGEIYSLRSSRDVAGACIRIQSRKVQEVKGPGNKASNITVSNAKIIKEWIEKEKFSLSSMGQGDYNQMPPTTWEEAKKLWHSDKVNFFRKGWFRGYRKEFEPELINMLANIFNELPYLPSQREGAVGREIVRGATRDQHWILDNALKSGVHHVYSNIFSKYLLKIADNFPQIYLRHNLPRTYSSKEFDKVHEHAINKVVSVSPVSVAEYINPKSRRADFDESILDKLKAREKDVMVNILKLSEKKAPVDLTTVIEIEMDQLYSVSGVFRNTSLIKKYPKITRKIAENMKNTLDYIPDDMLRGIVGSRLYRTGGVFEEIIVETIDDIKKTLDKSTPLDEEAPEPWTGVGEEAPEWESVFTPGPDELPEAISDPNRGARYAREDYGETLDSLYFFKMGFHTTKEYRHLTEDMADDILTGPKKKAEDADKDSNLYDSHIDLNLYNIEKHLLGLKSVSDEQKKEIAKLKLKHSYNGASDYLRDKKYYGNPLFVETTIAAINSLPIFEDYAVTHLDPMGAQESGMKREPLGSLRHRRLDLTYAITSAFPRIIRKTSGIIPEELTKHMKKALLYAVEKHGVQANNHYGSGWRFLNNPHNREFEDVSRLILKNSLIGSKTKFEESMGWDPDLYEFEPVFGHDELMSMFDEKLYDIRDAIALLRYIKKFNLENETGMLPQYLMTFGRYNKKLAEDFNKLFAKVSEWRSDDSKKAMAETFEQREANVISKINKHIGHIRQYINIGMHKTKPNYNKELYSAIKASNKLIFINLKSLYKNYHFTDSHIFSWKIFGPKTSADEILNKYYYNDPDYPSSLYEKDRYLLDDLSEQLVIMGEKSNLKQEQLGDFVYGFMYWAVLTFNSMGEEAAAQSDNIEEYMEYFKDIWPKRTSIKDDELFYKGYTFRGEIEMASFPEVSRPVSYDEDEVSQQIAKDYFTDRSAWMNEPDYEALQIEEDARLDALQENTELDEWRAPKEDAEEEEEKEGVIGIYDPATGDHEEDPNAWRSENADESPDADVKKESRLRRLWMFNKLSA